MGELSLRRISATGVKSVGYSGSYAQSKSSNTIGTSYSIYNILGSWDKSLFDAAKSFLIAAAVNNNVCTFIITELGTEVQADGGGITITARLYVSGSTVYLQAKSTSAFSCATMSIPFFNN